MSPLHIRKRQHPRTIPTHPLNPTSYGQEKTPASSDMQWADDSSLELLKYCLPICDNESLLWLLSFRPERDTSIWEFYHYLEAEYPHRLTSVELLPLTAEQSLKLINHLVGSDALPDETSNLIIRNAGGNPYYIQVSDFF